MNFCENILREDYCTRPSKPCKGDTCKWHKIYHCRENVHYLWWEYLHEHNWEIDTRLPHTVLCSDCSSSKNFLEKKIKIELNV